MFKNKLLVGRFRDFISSVSKKDRVAILHHTDPDGICSGVIISKLIERIRKKKIDLRINQKGNIHHVTEDTLKKLRKHRINKVIVVDLNIDICPLNLTKLAKFTKVLILDHHPVTYPLLSNVLVIKSSMLSNIPSSKYCAAKLCYDLGCHVADISDLDWLAAVGSISDIATDYFRPWLRGVFRKYYLKINRDLFKTKFGEVAIFISSAESFDSRNVKLCFDTAYRAKSYRDVLQSKLRSFRKKIDDELQYYIKNVNNLAEIYPDLDLIIYEIRPKYNTKSPLSTLLGIKYPHKTVLIVDLRNSMATVSARRGDSLVSVNTLLERAIQGWPNCNAGGHLVSSGASFPKKYYKKFKKRIISLLEKR